MPVRIATAERIRIIRQLLETRASSREISHRVGISGPTIVELGRDLLQTMWKRLEGSTTMTELAADLERKP